jgi:4'-phosphopantetheinyl transferase
LLNPLEVLVFRGGRVRLREVLASLGLPTEVAHDHRGKPYLAGRPDIGVSLARSGGVELFALAEGIEVGVDIERLRPVPEYLAIAERYFPPSRYRALVDMPAEEQEREFFREWTRFEAAVKALGTGLFGAGREFEGDWTVVNWKVGEGFVAAVAARAANVRVVT